MVAEGSDLAKIHKNIVVKLPMTKDGLKATKVLAGQGIKVNMTLVFSPSQALLAAKVGAATSAPSWEGSTTSATTAWTSCARSSRSTTTTGTIPR